MTGNAWEGLNPPYATIVADPPWRYEDSPPGYRGRNGQRKPGWLPYSSLTVDEIAALPVGDLAEDTRLFLWTTNRHVRHVWDVAEAWGFEPQHRLMVWCKPPEGTNRISTEFVLVCKRGRPASMPWCGTTWFHWARPTGHSVKPDAFYDLVESWCPGPYVDVFARAPRLGWDSWGYGYESGAAS